MSVIVEGSEKWGSKLLYKKERGKLIPGLLLKSGEEKWFKGFKPFDFHNERAVADNGKKSGVINRDGDFVIDPYYEAIDPFSEKKTFAMKGEYTFLLDYDGKVLKKWNDILITSPFSNGLARVRELSDDTTSFSTNIINKDGNAVLEDIELVKISNPYQLMDKDDNFSDGLFRVNISNKYGFIDASGETIIPPIYKSVSAFNSGYACYRISKGYGYINKGNERVTGSKYEYATSFYRNLAFARVKGKWQVLGPDCEVIDTLPYKFDIINNNIPEYLLVFFNGKQGLMDYSFRIIFEPKYDHIVSYSDGILIFNNDNHRGVADLKGNELISTKPLEAEYEMLSKGLRDF